MRFLLSAVILASTSTSAQEKAPALDPEAAGSATRIWSKATHDGQQLFFRRTFELPKGVKSARIVATCDDICSVWVNDEKRATALMWEKLIVIDLQSLPKGKNVVAISGTNRGGPAALAAWILWTDAAAKKHEIVTDEKWRVSDQEEKDWTTRKFDDSGWPAATGGHETPFGGTVYGSEPAEYVWVNGFAAAAEAIERALESMRRARTDEAALRSLDAIERAVMRARREIRKADAPRRRK